MIEHSATVESKLLLPDGPQYKALLIDNTTSLNPENARQVLSYANLGLPVVIIGDPPSQPQSLYNNHIQATAQVANTMQEIMSLETTKQVSSQSEAPAALKSLGVDPSVRYSTSSNVSTITTKRRLSETDHVYFIYTSAAVNERISLEGEGFPLALNLWTGQVTPIAAFNVAAGYTEFNISLDENAAQAIYLGRRNPYGISSPTRHVTATDAQAVAISGRLFLRSGKNGTYAASLSDGETVRVRFDGIPAPVSPTSWTLSVEDWSPAYVNETGSKSSFTAKDTLPIIKLNTLKSWADIAALESASGIGTYRTTVELYLGNGTAKGGESMGVLLAVGKVGGSHGLKINNIAVDGVELVSPGPLDITSYLRNGVNGMLSSWTTKSHDPLVFGFPS